MPDRRAVHVDLQLPVDLRGGPGWGHGRAIAVGIAVEGVKILAVERDPGRLQGTTGCVRRRRDALCLGRFGAPRY
jgi:hypothetical protein